MSRFEKYENMNNPEKIKKLLRRDAIIYTEFEKRCDAISDYFDNERFGLYEMFREFIARADDACMIRRIEDLKLVQQERESLKTEEPQVWAAYEEIEKNKPQYEKYFNVNYAPLDVLMSTGKDEYKNIYMYENDFFEDPEPIGESKKVYSNSLAKQAMERFFERNMKFDENYLNFPIITPKGRAGTSNLTALVQIDFSKPDEEILDYLLTLKREFQQNPALSQDLDHFLDKRIPSQKCRTAEEIWDALRSHKTKDGKGLSTRWADMLFIYDCEQYLIKDKTYIKDEIDRYWHQKSPLNFESYGNAYCLEELKNMLRTDFDKESDKLKEKYTKKHNGTSENYDFVNWAKYGLSKSNKVEKIKAMILSYWNEDSEENKYPHYARKIKDKTYDRNQTLIKAMIDEGKITKFMFGIDLSKRTQYVNSIPPEILNP